MEDFLINLVDGSAAGVWSYLLVFGILLACGVGVPLPEDVSLILGGYLAHGGKADLFTMMVVGYLGIIIGDSMIFMFGRRVGSRVGSKPGGFFSRIITPEKRARVELLFGKHGEKIIMLARFMPGVRTVTYFTAGSVKMRYGRFVLFDSIAALASAPVFVWLGYKFGGELDQLIDAVRRGQTAVLGVIVVLLITGFVVYRVRSKREARLNAEALRKVTLEEMGAVTPARPQPDSKV